MKHVNILMQQKPEKCGVHLNFRVSISLYCTEAEQNLLLFQYKPRFLFVFSCLIIIVIDFFVFLNILFCL